MNKWGVRLTGFGMLWAVVGMTLFIPQVRSLTSNAIVRALVFAIGFTGTIAIIGGWFMAIVDWSRRRPRRLVVGVALICFNFLAAWAYWIYYRDSPRI